MRTKKTSTTGALGRALDEMLQDTLGLYNGTIHEGELGASAEEPLVPQNEFWRQNMFMIVVISVASMSMLGLAIGLAVVDRRKDKQRRERVAAVVGDTVPMGGLV